MARTPKNQKFFIGSGRCIVPAYDQQLPHVIRFSQSSSLQNGPDFTPKALTVLAESVPTQHPSFQKLFMKVSKISRFQAETMAFWQCSDPASEPFRVPGVCTGSCQIRGENVWTLPCSHLQYFTDLGTKLSIALSFIWSKKRTPMPQLIVFPFYNGNSKFPTRPCSRKSWERCPT